MYQVVDGKVYHLNEQLGMPENSNLQILVDAWALTIPEEGREDFLKEFNRESLLNRFENGERHISDMYPQYWTPSIGGICIKNIRMHRTSEFANFGGITRINE